MLLDYNGRSNTSTTLHIYLTNDSLPSIEIFKALIAIVLSSTQMIPTRGVAIFSTSTSPGTYMYIKIDKGTHTFLLHDKNKMAEGYR